jgi:hypothetical protein
MQNQAFSGYIYPYKIIHFTHYQYNILLTNIIKNETKN